MRVGGKRQRRLEVGGNHERSLVEVWGESVVAAWPASRVTSGQDAQMLSDAVELAVG
jgi:hypothetical protein